MSKLYCLVQSGNLVVSSITTLPEVYKNVSNFNALEYENPTLLYDLTWCGSPNLGFYEVQTGSVPQCNVSYDIICTFTINNQNHTVAQGFHTENVSQEVVNQRQEDLWNQIRVIRNSYLKNTDWTQLSDTNLSPSKVNEYVIFRQKLRSLPEDFTTPQQVVWPTIPSGSDLNPFPDVPIYNCAYIVR